MKKKAFLPPCSPPPPSLAPIFIPGVLINVGEKRKRGREWKINAWLPSNQTGLNTHAIAQLLAAWKPPSLFSTLFYLSPSPPPRTRPFVAPFLLI